MKIEQKKLLTTEFLRIGFQHETPLPRYVKGREAAKAGDTLTLMAQSEPATAWLFQPLRVA